MATINERQEYLSEHLSYELLMLRYTAHRLPHVRDQLLWNTLFESFGVHARNLYDFLRNEKDNRNFKASDFIKRFDCGTTDSIRGSMDKLHQQLLHLGKRRHKDGDQKLSATNVQYIKQWIENAIAKFTSELGQEYRDYWKPDDADPTKVQQNIPAGAAPTQSSSPNYTMTKSITDTSSSTPVSFTGYPRGRESK